MRRIKALAALLIVLGSASAMAAEPEMAPIEDFLAQNLNSKNGAVEVHVGLRCYSLFRIMSFYTENNNMAETSKKYKDSSLTFLEMASKAQSPKNQSYLLGQVDIMISSYINRFLKAKALTGNFSDDPVISKDMKFCSDILKDE